MPARSARAKESSQRRALPAAAARAAERARRDGGAPRRHIGSRSRTRPRSRPRARRPPGDCTLQRAQAEDPPQPPPETRVDESAPLEEEQRQEEGYADQAAKQTMAPFPPIDALELGKRHARIGQLIFRRGPIFGELGIPIRR